MIVTEEFKSRRVEIRKDFTFAMRRFYVKGAKDQYQAKAEFKQEESFQNLPKQDVDAVQIGADIFEVCVLYSHTPLLLSWRQELVGGFFREARYDVSWDVYQLKPLTIKLERSWDRFAAQTFINGGASFAFSQ